MMSDAEVADVVLAAVTAWVKEISGAGFKTVPELNELDEGRALEQSLATFLDTTAIDLYPRLAAELSAAGLRDAELQQALNAHLKRINVEILRRLLSLGFRVDRLLEIYESGQPLKPLHEYFTLDHH
jgi:hypothetical protein